MTSFLRIVPILAFATIFVEYVYAQPCQDSRSDCQLSDCESKGGRKSCRSTCEVCTGSGKGRGRGRHSSDKDAQPCQDSRTDCQLSDCESKGGRRRCRSTCEVCTGSGKGRGRGRHSSDEESREHEQERARRCRDRKSNCQQKDCESRYGRRLCRLTCGRCTTQAPTAQPSTTQPPTTQPPTTQPPSTQPPTTQPPTTQPPITQLPTTQPPTTQPPTTQPPTTQPPTTQPPTTKPPTTQPPTTQPPTTQPPTTQPPTTQPPTTQPPITQPPTTQPPTTQPPTTQPPTTQPPTTQPPTTKPPTTQPPTTQPPTTQPPTTQPPTTQPPTTQPPTTQPPTTQPPTTQPPTTQPPTTQAESFSCGVGVQSTIANDATAFNTNRIIGGTTNVEGAWPWLLVFQLYGSHVCGASLVSVGNNQWSDIAITAAHCVQDRSDRPRPASALSVKAGEYSLDNPDSTEQESGVDQYHYPGHPSNGYNADIAVLKLSTPIYFDDYALPVCIPLPSQDPPVGDQCVTTGWGLTNSGYPDLPEEVALPIISDSLCGYEYTGYNFNGSQEICAAFPQGGRDSCSGDSGGPLNCYHAASGRWMLTGVVSWGVGCAEEGWPGVYAQSSSHYDYLMEQICSMSDNPTIPECL